MRFCLVSTQEKFGGGEVLLHSMADELYRVGHSVGWIVRKDSQVAHELKSGSGQILHGCHNRGRSLRDLLAVRSVLKQWMPDVLLMNDTHAVMLAGLASLSLRRPRPVRFAYKHTIFPLRSRLKYRLLTDKVVCVSEAARRTLLEGGISGQDAIVVYGGARTPSPCNDARIKIRSELELDDATCLLVCIGNLLPCKGHGDLLSAIARIDRAIPVRLIIAGEGAERAKLELQIRELGLEDRVRLLGFRQDIDCLMQAADLVVHPSHAEGLSLVLIQAQLLMKPIVATAVGGAAEVLGVTGRQNNQLPATAAWIAQPQNAANLASQIEHAIAALRDRRDHGAPDDIRNRLSKAAQRTRRLFSLEANTKKLADLAAQLLSADASAR